MKKWKAIFNKQKGIYEVYPEKAGNMRICAVVNQIDEGKIARLIAAAPDLLAAMKAMFKECAMIHKYGGTSYNGKQAAAAIKAGRDAIAKAEVGV